MSKPQAGILPEPSEHARFVILRVTEPAAAAARIAKALSRIPALTEKLAATDKRAKLVCTIGIGSEFWSLMAPRRRPKGMRPFLAVGTRAPNTGGDILFHILSKRIDLNFELAQRIMNELGEGVEVMDDVTGFRYLDTRDLIGFQKGTANPKGTKLRSKTSLIGKEDPRFAGGSFVFTQRYVHELPRWNTLPLSEQEGIVGRRKRDSKEIPDKSRPLTSHVSRVTIEENGEQLAIMRHSFPYGNLKENGLFFIAYTRDLAIPEEMLARMMGTAGDGLQDALMEFTHAMSGATFFAPSLEVLRAIGIRA